jgi:hypothetical protein
MLQEVREAFKLAEPSALDDDEMRLPERVALAQALQKSGAKLPTMPAKLLPEDNAFLLYTMGQADGSPQPMYELLTCEYVAALAAYVHERCVFYHQQQQESSFSPTGSINPNEAEEPTQQSLQIIELGSGDGRLAHFLRCKLQMLSLRAELPPPKLVASDTLEFGLTPHFPVQRLGHQEALQMVPGPTLVIVSWMPSGVDFTEAIRACGSVQEYILIGEADGSVCGDAAKTWGISAATLSSEQQQRVVGIGDFERTDAGLTPLQICRSDSSSVCGFSRTVSFRRGQTRRTGIAGAEVAGTGVEAGVGAGAAPEGVVSNVEAEEGQGGDGSGLETRIVLEVVPEDVLTTAAQADAFYRELKQSAVAGVKEWFKCTHAQAFGMLSLHVTCSLDIANLPQHHGKNESLNTVCQTIEMQQQVQCVTVIDSFEAAKIESQHQKIRAAQSALDAKLEEQGGD